jgi:cellulose synthase/poly-beta-1,6-N-acetylglucosamine synthase-like glycosyltransferase
MLMTSVLIGSFKHTKFNHSKGVVDIHATPEDESIHLPRLILFMFSQAAEVAHHLGKNRRFKRLAGIAYVLLSLAFMAWGFWAINPAAPVVGFLFALANVYGCVTGLFLIWNSSSIRLRGDPPKDFQPRVDVMIPVYTEPVEMIELTVMGAKNIQYPHETFLLDDGKRPELKAIAEKHGIRYVTREGNRGSKAGNVNDALHLSSADFVAIFDADHIPQCEALDSMVGFFKDSEVAMVQAPQLFYNEDSFLYLDTNVGAGRWHEQALFMDVIQANRDHYDGCSCIGTGVVYRRSAVAELGGFPEATLTEDLHTSLLMHKRGMKTAYVNEPVAWGVAASDVSEFYKTRRRWGYGNLQAFALENVLFCKGLGWKCRLGYLHMILDILQGWPQLIHLITPIYSMMTNISPVKPSFFNLIISLTGIAGLMTLLIASSSGYIRFVQGQVFSMGLIFIQIGATRGFFGKKMPWQISLKNVLGRVALDKLFAHGVMLAGSVLALVYAFIHMVQAFVWPDPSKPGAVWLLGMVSAWIIFNCWRSWTWICSSIKLTKRTHREYLFEAKLPVLDDHGKLIATTRRLSTQQCEFEFPSDGPSMRVGQKLTLLIPGHRVEVIVAEGGQDCIIEMQCADEISKDLLRRSLYSVDWHRQPRLSRYMQGTLSVGLGGDWKAVGLRSEGGTVEWALYLEAPEGFKKDRLMLLEATDRSQPLQIEKFQDGQTTRQSICFGTTIKPARPVPKGLLKTAFVFLEIELAN